MYAGEKLFIDKRENLTFLFKPSQSHKNQYNLFRDLCYFINNASYQLSIAATASKIVQESYHWLPAHLTSVLFIILKHEIVNFQNPRNSWFIKPYVGFFQYKSFYIITGTGLNSNLILTVFGKTFLL